MVSQSVRSTSTLITEVNKSLPTFVQHYQRTFTFLSIQDTHGWQDEYGAFTYSINEKDRLIEYVKNQKEHHKIMTFREKYIEILKEHGIDFDDNFCYENIQPFQG